MKLLTALIVLLSIFGLSFAATNLELEAKTYVGKASDRVYNLYNKLAAEIYDSNDVEEDFDAFFSKYNNVKTIATELVEIAQEAGEFDLKKIQDPELKKALEKLSKSSSLFVLGEDYFTEVLINLASLKQLSRDKDIEPYKGGINQPNQDDSNLSYYPDIRRRFQQSNDSEELQYYWETWREKNSIWATINFYNIVEAFQKTAKELDMNVLEFYFKDFGGKNFIDEMEKVMEELLPAYKEFHAFVRSELNKKYGNDVIDPNGPIPDHLFEQVLAQVWKEGSVIENYFPYKELPPYDGFVKDFDAKKEIEVAQGFYKSLGFSDLDEKFSKNQLKQQTEEANSGDCHADIFDLTPKVYMLYCEKVDFKKFMQMHGYLSRYYYANEKRNLPAYDFESYDLEYPVGEAVILSAGSPKHLQTIGLAKNFDFNEKTMINRLFRMGIHTIMEIPVYYVHSRIMNDLLGEKVDMDGINKHYWKLMEKYAGVEPPVNREEGVIDFPYKFYTDLENNHQTQKFVSEVLGYQFYKSFCKKSTQEGPLYNCDFYDNKAVGTDLKSMMSLGSSKSFHEVIGKIIPENPNLSASALLEYYAPLLDWLKMTNKQNKLKIGWNESKKKVL